MDADGSGSLTREDIELIIKEKEEKEENPLQEMHEAQIAELRLNGDESLLPSDQ
jgi:hypothetical protein